MPGLPARSRLAIAALSIAIVLLLIVPSQGITRGPVGAARPLSSEAGRLLGEAGAAAPLPPVGASRSLGAPPPTPLPGCPTTVAHWASLYGSSTAPPSVRGTDAPGCVPGADSEGVSYGSNASGSGANFEVTVVLPGTSANEARALSSFFVQSAVSGVPCSLDGRSVLRIELLPPGSPIASSIGDVWTVVAPIWDLVPAGACDPRCENTSMLWSIGSIGFCEDNALVRGIGSPGWSSNPSLSPGDSLRITVHPGGGSGLTVYLNDTSHPASSTYWTYGSTSTVAKVAAEPYSTTPDASAGWAVGGDLSVGWTNCPVGNASPGASACLSYDGAVQHALSFPRVVNASYYSAASGRYVGAYDTFAPWSSSGACSGAANATGCSDFATSGGTGSYPALSIVASGGSAALVYGPNATDVARTLAGPAGGFPPDGSAAPVDPAVLRGIGASVNNSTIKLHVRATDPRGVFAVEFGALWCFTGGAITTPIADNLTAIRGPGGSNGSMDANFTANFPRGNNTTGGSLYYWAREFASSTDLGSPRDPAKATVPRVARACGTAAPPPVAGGPITPISDGYRVGWQFPSLDEPMARNFSLVAVPLSGTPTVTPVPDPASRSAVIVGLLPLTSYTVYIGLTLLDGTTISVGQSPGYRAPPTLTNFSFSVSSSALSLTQPGASLSLSVGASGGKGPYSFHVEWGNGTATWTYRVLSNAVVARAFPGYEGVARILVEANDSVGNALSASPILVRVAATPLGVALALSAGDNTVALSWSSPPSPGGAVSGYVVFYTQDAAALGTFTEGWPSNLTGAHPVSLFNTTGSSARFSAVDGLPFFAAVIAWNSWGPGLLPASGPASALPAPFALVSYGAPSLGALGGSAPFSVALTAETSGGTNNPLVRADFTVFSLGLDVVGSLAASGTSSATTAWANATILFPKPGTFRVGVNLEDRLLDPVLVSLLTVYVSPGAGPTLSIVATTPSPFSGHAVSFRGSASDTPGPFNLSWQFGDGSSLYDAGANVSHTYSVAGAFTVLLTAVDNTTGGRSSLSQPVEILLPPTIRILASAGPGSSLTWTFTLDLVGGSGSPVVAWSFGDGTSGGGVSTTSTTHTYARPGEYTVRATSTDPAGIVAASNVTIWAGLLSSPSAPSTTGYLALSLGLAAALVVAAVTAIVFFRKSRPPKAEIVSPDTYTLSRRPPPKDAVE